MLLLLIASMDIAVQDFSYPPLFRGGVAAKDLGPGAIIGVVCYQRRRIVAYSAYISKALGVTSAWGLCGMHPGTTDAKRRGVLVNVILHEKTINTA